MDRRTFIGAFAGGLVVARSVAAAQPAAKVYRISFLALAVAKSAAEPEGLELIAVECPALEGRNGRFGSIVLKNSSHSTEWSELPKFDLVERPLLNATHAGDGL